VIRPYEASDFNKLRAIHISNGYGLDFNLLTFPHRRVLEIDGKVVGAVLGRLSMQIDLILDREGGNLKTAPARWERLMLLARAGEEYERGINIRHEHCFVPQEIVRGYGPRLESMGFVREVGACYLKDLNGQ
jgi:hypothetical protein